MIPTEKGEVDNVCKDDENEKKRFNRINRSNTVKCSLLVGNQSKRDNREKNNKLTFSSSLEAE